MALPTHDLNSARQQPQENILESQTAPVRSPTASLRDRLRRALALTVREPDLDSLEQWLQPDPSQQEFLRDYRRLKRSPGRNVIQSLTWYHVHNERPAGASDSLVGESPAENPVRQSSATFSQALDEFSSKLRLGSDSSLKVW